MVDNSEIDWEAQYRNVRGSYESFSRRLSELLADLCAGSGIDVAQIEQRAKDVESFLEKISRKGEKYSDPLNDITDLAGLRIIVYYQEDVRRVGEMIRKDFDIDDGNSVDKSGELDEDRFGYQSVHFVVSLGANRAALGEWKRFKGLKAEVQVRTVLQHAWAAVNHKLDYKSAGEAPREIRRKFFRLSALFELADEEFSSLRDARAKIQRTYVLDAQNGKVDLPLDLASLAAYLENDPHIRDLTQEFVHRPAIVSEQNLLRDRRDLLTVLKQNKYESTSELTNFVLNAFPRAVKFTMYSEKHKAHTVEDLLTQAVAVSVGDRKFLYSVYHDDYQPLFDRLITDYEANLTEPRSDL